MRPAFFSLVTAVGGFRNVHFVRSFFKLYHFSKRSRMLKTSYPPRTLASLIMVTTHSRNENGHTSHITQSKSLYHEKACQLANASTLSLAPMMDYTDRHFRRLVRLISTHTLLYTEMITANAIVQQHQKYITAQSDPMTHPNRYLDKLIGQGRVEPLEGPCVLQLGGSNPDILGQATAIVFEQSQQQQHPLCDYTAINLNCGCPSPKVAGSGCFGAALMSEPHLVKDCVLAMSQGCHSTLPITVKCRIGTDEHITPFDRNNIHTPETKKRLYQKLCEFIDIVSSSGVVTDFQIHSRIAVLDKNFSPADNRNIPPLQYDLVYQLVHDFPHLSFSLNGGVDSLQHAQQHLHSCQGLKGVMIGRAWVSNPWAFALTDELLYKDNLSNNHYVKPQNRLEVLQAYCLHADEEERVHEPGKVRRPLLKAITNLFTGEKNARKYRIGIDDLASGRSKTQNELRLSQSIINIALECLGEEVLLQSP